MILAAGMVDPFRDGEAPFPDRLADDRPRRAGRGAESARSASGRHAARRLELDRPDIVRRSWPHQREVRPVEHPVAGDIGDQQVAHLREAGRAPRRASRPIRSSSHGSRPSASRPRAGRRAQASAGRRRSRRSCARRRAGSSTARLPITTRAIPASSIRRDLVEGPKPARDLEVAGRFARRARRTGRAGAVRARARRRGRRDALRSRRSSAKAASAAAGSSE